MMDVRIKDSIRNTEQLMEAERIDLKRLIEAVKTLTGLVRDIKKSTVRKYGKGE